MLAVVWSGSGVGCIVGSRWFCLSVVSWVGGIVARWWLRARWSGVRFGFPQVGGRGVVSSGSLDSESSSPLSSVVEWAGGFFVEVRCLRRLVEVGLLGKSWLWVEFGLLFPGSSLFRLLVGAVVQACLIGASSKRGSEESEGLAGWLVGGLVACLVGWLVACVLGWLMVCWVGWLVGWLVCC